MERKKLTALRAILISVLVKMLIYRNSTPSIMIINQIIWAEFKTDTNESSGNISGKKEL